MALSTCQKHLAVSALPVGVFDRVLFFHGNKSMFPLMNEGVDQLVPEKHLAEPIFVS